MASLNTSIIFMLLFTLLSYSSEAAPTYSSHACDNATTFTPNSTYQANMKTLLSSLSSNTSSSKNGFYNTTAGQDPNLVYGTFLCRGDVSANLCQDCVASASNDIAQRCLTEKVGVIWYDECTVRYSDQNIFSIIREVPGVDKSSSASITNKDRFNQLLSNVMTSLENRAAYEDQSGKRFAAGEANFTSSQKLYSLVQCTPDLTDALCFRCLQSAIATIPTCCDGKQGARVLLPSCNIRYEMFPFYQLNGTTSLVPSPSSPNSTKGKRKISSPIIIAIVAPIVISLVLLALALFLLRRRASKKYDSLPEENVSEEITTSESLKFNLATIEAATNNFSSDNKIGEGGFGEVYKSWKHWTNGTPLELLDSNLRANCSRNEVVRCIHIGLLCVQEDPANRPTMTRVGLMLDSYSVSLPLPQKPAFFLRSRNELSPQGKGLKSSDQSSSKSTTLSINEVSVTELEPR
ncbi:hypothetical protein SCA6_020324 [Theobroma cacao]